MSVEDFIFNDIDMSTVETSHFSNIVISMEFMRLHKTDTLFLSLLKNDKYKTIIEFPMWKNMISHVYRKYPRECLFLYDVLTRESFEKMLKVRPINGILCHLETPFVVMERWGLTKTSKSTLFGDIKYVFILSGEKEDDEKNYYKNKTLAPEWFTPNDGLKIWHFLD